MLRAVHEIITSHALLAQAPGYGVGLLPVHHIRNLWPIALPPATTTSTSPPTSPRPSETAAPAIHLCRFVWTAPMSRPVHDDRCQL